MKNDWKKIEKAMVGKHEKKATVTVPTLLFLSDTFYCPNCGCRGIYKVYGDTKTCPECGGTMYRQ